MTEFITVLAFLAGCTVNNYYVYEAPARDSSTNSDADTGSADTAGAETVPGYTSETCAASPDEFTASVWEKDGISYHFEVSADQLEQMNENWSDGWYGDYYVYDVDEDEDLTFTDTACIVDPISAVSADFGQIQLKLTGQSTGTTWDNSTIPPLSADVGEFVDGQVLGADKTRWLAFHPGTVSYIFSEPVVYAVLGALGEPVPRTSLAWISSNVWGKGIQVPYNTIEKYKDDWCADHADQLGGGCVNIWEGLGDFSSDYLSYLKEDCELSGDCDDTHLTEFVNALAEVPYDDSFEESTDEFVDWPAIKRSMCGSWMLWIGDDPFHNLNNVVTVEQADGKFRLLYYSADLSAGASGWYQYTTLNGWNILATGCYADRECWESTLDTCEGLIADLEKADPVGIVDSFWERLQAADMARDGDEGEYQRIREWYEIRVIELPDELACYRDQYESQWVRGGGGGFRGHDCSQIMSEYL